MTSLLKVQVNRHNQITGEKLVFDKHLTYELVYLRTSFHSSCLSYATRPQVEREKKFNLSWKMGNEPVQVPLSAMQVHRCQHKYCYTQEKSLHFPMY